MFCSNSFAGCVFVLKIGFDTRKSVKQSQIFLNRPTCRIGVARASDRHSLGPIRSPICRDRQIAACKLALKYYHSHELKVIQNHFTVCAFMTCTCFWFLSLYDGQFNCYINLADKKLKRLLLLLFKVANWRLGMPSTRKQCAAELAVWMFGKHYWISILSWLCSMEKAERAELLSLGKIWKGQSPHGYKFQLKECWAWSFKVLNLAWSTLLPFCSCHPAKKLRYTLASVDFHSGSSHTQSYSLRTRINQLWNAVTPFFVIGK